MEFEKVREKVISNIEVLIREKQMLFTYLVYILQLIENKIDDTEVNSYAKSQIGSYIVAMIERSGNEQEINELILDYLDSCLFPEEFEFSAKKEMIVGFLKILENSYFKRANSYSRITSLYDSLIKRRILIEEYLEIDDSTDYLDQKKYELMKNAVKNKIEE